LGLPTIKKEILSSILYQYSIRSSQIHKSTYWKQTLCIGRLIGCTDIFLLRVRKENKILIVSQDKPHNSINSSVLLSPALSPSDSHNKG